MNAAEFKVMIAQQDEMVADLQKDLTELEAIQSRMGHNTQHTVRELSGLPGQDEEGRDRHDEGSPPEAPRDGRGMKAAWAPVDVVATYGADPEGFKFCSLCGEDCPRGVLIGPKTASPPTMPRRDGVGYFCEECVKKMAAALPS